MSSVDKIVEKMKRQPKGIRFQEAEKVLAAYGYHFNRQKGSHRHYLHDNGDLITLKEQNPIRISYVTDILERIEEK